MTTFTRKLAINEFVERQTRDSEFSHFEGSLAVVLSLADAHWPDEEDGKPVVYVEVPAEGFFCGVVKVTDTTVLKSQLVVRHEGEEPHIVTLAFGAEKTPGAKVTLVFYSHTKLALKDEQTFEDAEYELISINVEEGVGKTVPMHPRTMASNHLNKPGGSERKYTADQFAKSIDHWKDRVMNGGVK